jgi:pseudouridine synthase
MNWESLSSVAIERGVMLHTIAPMHQRGRRSRPTHPFTDAARGERLQRVMADAGIGSRRHCEELIEMGEVAVNGTPVTTLPAWVDPSKDRIVVSGRKLRARERHVYVMLFKPRGVVSTSSDPEGRKRATDLVRHPSRARLHVVGRLDMDSSGLILLTNDGELTNRLTHPRYEVHKKYEVTVKGSLSANDVAKLEDGIWLYDKGARSGSKTRGVRLKLLKRDRERTLILMELREGRNRQIRRMMHDLGHSVRKLRRVQMGPLKLKGLSVGEWRDLTSAQVGALKKAAGMAD